MRSLIEYFGCGNVYIRERAVDFIVQKSSDLDSKIIPFFNKYLIVGEKFLNFKDFCIIAELIKQNKHLTESGLDQILVLLTPKGVRGGPALWPGLRF
jgi:LAGLIDADG DNA endonuclease family protein